MWTSRCTENGMKIRLENQWSTPEMIFLLTDMASSYASFPVDISATHAALLSLFHIQDHRSVSLWLKTQITSITKPSNQNEIQIVNSLNCRVNSIGLIPFFFMRCNSSHDVNFLTKYADTTKPRLKSVHQDTLILFITVGDNLTFDVTLTGRGGRFGSTPGLFVGIGLGNAHALLFTLTLTFGGKQSSCSVDVSSTQNRNCTWTTYSALAAFLMSLMKHD